jgi:PKHD-type hydroxylase
MKSTERYFEENGFVVLKDALSKNTCDDLVKHMFDLHSEGKTTKDIQCPLSDSIYSDETFQKVLESFTKPIGEHVGRELVPAYTYARIYRSGEVLKPHKDRPACEISATITLGFKAKKIWPIYFDEHKQIPIELEIGEMVLYKGCEIEHWRLPFKGEWQVQVFLHYVDANGPHAKHANDAFIKNAENTKNVLGNNKTFNNKPSNIIYNSALLLNEDLDFPGYYCIDENNLPEFMFTEKECEQIISLKEELYPTTAAVGGKSKDKKIAKEVRSAEIYNIDLNPETKWIFDKILQATDYANRNYFNFDIIGITHSLQLIRYSAQSEIKGHYNWHIDSGNGETSTRKISVTCQLSNPRKYNGCELVINNNSNEIIATKQQGSIHLFPSFMLHKVTPITSGDRYALVIWIHGSKRFR